MQIRRFDPENGEEEVAAIHNLVVNDLSEPYSQFVYQYFIRNWPELYFIAETDEKKIVGGIVCSLRIHRERRMRAYIAMLAVAEEYRGQGIARKLINTAVDALRTKGADEVTLETEVDNVAALNLYERLGFLRTRRMNRYYLNAKDAFRLTLPLSEKSVKLTAFLPALNVPAQKLI